MDLALPDDSRRTVRVLSLASGKLKNWMFFRSQAVSPVISNSWMVRPFVSRCMTDRSRHCVLPASRAAMSVWQIICHLPLMGMIALSLLAGWALAGWFGVAGAALAVLMVLKLVGGGKKTAVQQGMATEPLHKRLSRFP